MAEETNDDPSAQFRKIVDDFLSAASQPMEDAVNTKAYGEMLGQTISNLVALNRINGDTMDLTLRNLRIASRADIVSLHRQLARTEDKLEAVLEAVERLEERLAEDRPAPGPAAPKRRPASPKQ